MTTKKRWQDLSKEQRTAVMVAGSVQIALLTAALADIAKRPSDQINGSKGKWVALSFVNFVGPISYFVFGRRRAL